jgi:hypothetical protein
VKDLSIVIPAYGKDEAIGLWSTVEACIFDLEDSGLTYDFRVCSNGVDTPNDNEKKIENNLRNAGLVGEWLHVREPQCPARARQMLSRNCDSKYMFLLDNHCIPCHGYFKRGVDTMEKYNVDLLHSVTKMFTGYRIDYEYKLTLEKNFWADEGYETPLKDEPYKVAAAGHGGIIHRTSTYKEIGGYWDGFNGYAGEEMYYDLKCWLLDKNVYIDPEFVHAHYAPVNRKYQRRSSEGYYLNMLMAANIIGGEQWLQKVFNKVKYQDIYPSQYEVIIDPDAIINIDDFIEEYEKHTGRIGKLDESYLNQAKMLSEKHAAWMSANQKITLDELLEYFKKNGIRT